MTCRRCSVCPGLSHHWMEDFDDGEWEYSPEPRPVWGCKHCDFTMPYDGEEDPEATYLGTLAKNEVPADTMTLPLALGDEECAETPYEQQCQAMDEAPNDAPLGWE